MKKIFFIAAATAFLASCGGPKTQELVIGDVTYTGETTEVAMTPTTPNGPAYTVVNKPQVNIEDFPMDEEGYYVIFNGNGAQAFFLFNTLRHHSLLLDVLFRDIIF